MRKIVLTVAALSAALVASHAQATSLEYVKRFARQGTPITIGKDEGLSAQDLLAVAAEFPQHKITVKCGGFESLECKALGRAGAHVVLNPPNEELDVVDILLAVPATKVTYVANGVVDGFSIVNYAKFGPYMKLRKTVSLDAHYIEMALKVSPNPERILIQTSCNPGAVATACFSSAELATFKKLGGRIGGS